MTLSPQPSLCLSVDYLQFLKVLLPAKAIFLNSFTEEVIKTQDVKAKSNRKSLYLSLLGRGQ